MRWAGHHEGGVRRPFQEESGRPAGRQYETPLVRRLNQWVDDLASGLGVPRAILLIGGPGNGKTDAIEGCIDRLDSVLNANGDLRKCFAGNFQSSSGRLSPRKVVVDLSALPLMPDHLRASFSLVQDATEGDPTENASAESLLLEELGGLASPQGNDIYLCCVNRGILAEASAMAHLDPAHEAAVGLINGITRAVTSSPTPPDCWPLEGYPHVAVWPMDLESLVAPPEGGGQSIAHQILQTIFEPSRWKPACALKNRCPFCQNRVLLGGQGAIDSLVDLLHYHELSSGKRWTFRDLFSLFSYLLVGEKEEFNIRGRDYSPCAWAAELNRMANDSGANGPDRDRAPFVLASRLYHHRLFPRWPSFDHGGHRAAKHEILKEGAQGDGIGAARAFFRFMARAGDLASKARGEVPSRLRKSLAPVLDPAASPANQVMFERGGQSPTTVGLIEEAFSLSIRAGLDLVGTQITTLERDVLKLLERADEVLSGDGFPGNRTHHARLLGSAIRQYAVRLVKRSLGTRRGVCRDVEHYRNYLGAMGDGTKMGEVRRQLQKLLNHQQGEFRAPLATTFGQPVAERSRDVTLIIPRTVQVQAVQPPTTLRRPREPLKYLRVRQHPVAVTFELFRALQEIAGGRHPASLPADIYGHLDRTRSMVAGSLVRDPDTLADGPRILFGLSGDEVEYMDGHFAFSRGEPG